MVAAPPSSSVVLEPATVVDPAVVDEAGLTVVESGLTVVVGSGSIESTKSPTKFIVKIASALCCQAKFACTVARAASAVCGVI